MVITKINPKGKSKSEIHLDGVYAGLLSNRDVIFWNLEQDAEITEEKWRDIESQCIVHSGKKKALDLLLVRERTTFELRTKLSMLNYTEAQIEEIMLYVQQFPYLDDVRYGVHYIVSMGRSKSRRQMEQTLMQRGLSKNEIEEAFAIYEAEYVEMAEDEECGSRETEAAENLLRKRLKGRTSVTSEERNKLYAMLARRGFSGDAIRKALREYEETSEED